MYSVLQKRGWFGGTQQVLKYLLGGNLLELMANGLQNCAEYIVHDQGVFVCIIQELHYNASKLFSVLIHLHRELENYKKALI